MKNKKEEKNTAVLVARLPQEEQVLFNTFGHNKHVEACIGGTFFLYECMGKGSDNQQCAPKILATVKVIDFAYAIDQGFMVTMQNETSNEKQVASHTPARLFGHDVFVMVPTSFGLQFNHEQQKDGKWQFNTSASLYVRTWNEAGHYSRTNIYLEPLRRMCELYPNQKQEWETTGPTARH